MKKWIGVLSTVAAAVAIGIVIRQISQDLSDNVELWKSVTDETLD
ncbi:DLW-39 family protein [Schaalia hyovaginalis]|uniref:Uncharacterized protein n=1 Tax=Schaalia hyovaginalis TaxID=29316 RepID=A0A923E294_9ACTO|nr:DLW-39 family protein [Schaalia hyovaginalis]MBB6333573.1 hypothetical protein [Schaalia hyovaginalis]MCI6411666.1 DLW-39 family protein [Schaalia hyovaginalis]MCI6556419.1 DLW-39 family protein [Schaalia hyovaginalis]MCI7513254.1 DLW-39 family protein [Schaalia hyovaginalis]MCI7671522.1 DLW-39 family protein [Schaalia hyovaginalis]